MHKSIRARYQVKALIVVVMLASLAVCAQESDSSYLVKGDRYVSLLIGYNGWANHFGEIGLAKHQLNLVGYHALGWSLFASSEIFLGNGETIIGPKIGCWAGGGVGLIAMGLSTIIYTDFDGLTWRLRPEIGFGPDRFKLVYGYNLPLTNADFEGINTHNISVAILLRLKNLDVNKN